VTVSLRSPANPTSRSRPSVDSLSSQTAGAAAFAAPLMSGASPAAIRSGSISAIRFGRARRRRARRR
jgi:hypothetical protein